MKHCRTWDQVETELFDDKERRRTYNGGALVIVPLYVLLREGEARKLTPDERESASNGWLVPITRRTSRRGLDARVDFDSFEPATDAEIELFGIEPTT